jgi:hypothetical protein
VGLDEYIEAAQADNRYLRVLELNYERSDPDVASSGTKPRIYRDDAVAWNGRELLHRTKDATTGDDMFSRTTGGSAADSFPPMSYMRNLGLSRRDPTTKKKQSDNWQQLWCMRRAIKRWPYAIKGFEVLDESPCMRVEAEFSCSFQPGKPVPGTAVTDTLWLDMKHAMALRKRMTQLDRYVIEIANGRFREVMPDLWLPHESQMACRDTVSPLASNVVYSESLVLQQSDARNIPQQLFDVALRRRKKNRLFGENIPYRYRNEWSQAFGGRTEQGWVLPGVGRRIERHDENGQLDYLVIDDYQRHWVYFPKLRRVILTPTHLNEVLPEAWNAGLKHFDSEKLCHIDEFVQTWEHTGGTLSSEFAELNGATAIKLVGTFPADPKQRGQWPIHDFEPETMRSVASPTFRTRTVWFHPDHLFPMTRECGCKQAKHTYSVDYLAAEDFDSNLFKFDMPADVTLDVSDPELLQGTKSEAREE